MPTHLCFRKSSIYLVLFVSAFCFTEQDSLRAQTIDKSGVITVRKLKDNNPRIAGKTGGDITPAELCNALGITSQIAGVKIIHYEITYYRGGEVTKEVEGNQVPPEICSYLNTTKPGMMITFEKILAQDASGMKFQLNPMRFKLVEGGSSEKENVSITREININGFYQLRSNSSNIEKTYLKLYNDSVVFITTSRDDAVIVNQSLEREYKKSGTAHGKYKINQGRLFIDLDNSISRFDYEGTFTASGLMLNQQLSNGTKVGDVMNYFILPFSR